MEFNDIRLTPELEQYRMLTDTNHKILGQIDRDMSYEELAHILESVFGFEKHESLYYAKAFINKIHMDIYK